MKILTLNTHSILESDYKKKLNQFADMILVEKPDVFALQEVNQSMDEEELKCLLGFGYVPCKDVLPQIKKDNHALNLDLLLRSRGMQYYWTWIPVKIGYGKYEEGLALFSLTPIADIDQFYISNSQDKENWKTRKMLGIQTCGHWFYSVHMGWWDDEEEPFAKHWDRAAHTLESKKICDAEYCKNTCPLKSAKERYCFIMGDFNAPAHICGEGYDYVSRSGWYDTWSLAEEKDCGYTVGNVIDGWKDLTSAMRIDYIWCDKKIRVSESKVICNGIQYPVVSDHYGTMIVFDV